MSEGYTFVYGRCWSCGDMFTFDAERVPSLTINGTRQPICGECMRLANEKRVALGLEPHFILPGAYDMSELLD